MKTIKTILLLLCLLGIGLLFTNHSYCDDSNPGLQEKTDYLQEVYKDAYELKKKEAEAVKAFEPTTKLGKFMMGIICPFLIVSVVLIPVGGMLIHSVFDDEFFKVVFKWYTIITVYLIINYVVWLLFKKSPNADAISIFTLTITGLLFILPLFLIFKDRAEAKKAAQMPSWRCHKCDSLNHHNDTCWHCNTKKQ